ncbi:MAG TPA: hypothetical protein VMV74_00775 [Bacteroidales bacterium]|nr:hypothetical protein [Bacteroidales bacterium]
MNNQFHNKGFESGGFLNLSAQEACEEARLYGAVIVDVREERL